jgi:hypothetical protein
MGYLWIMNTTNNTTEFRGSKFNHADVRDIAKMVRKDIAAEIKAGRLPAGLKASVTIDRFSMGQSIDIHVTALPVWFRVWDRAFVAFEIATNGRRCYDGQRYSREARAVIRRLEGLLAAYNRDDSDSQTDHFDVHFYGNVAFGYGLTGQDRERAEAEVKQAA